MYIYTYIYTYINSIQSFSSFSSGAPSHTAARPVLYNNKHRNIHSATVL